MFPVAAYDVGRYRPGGRACGALVHAAAERRSSRCRRACRRPTVTDAHRALVAALCHGTRRAIILGTLAQRHPAYAQLKALAAMLAELCGASVGFITEGANAAGAYLAGAVPHREPGGAPASRHGFVGASHAGGAAQGLCAARRHRPGSATSRPMPTRCERGAGWSRSPRICPRACAASAHVVLPIGSFAETSGTYVNAEGRWQSWAGAAKSPGESRPGWKVLRVLANLLNLHGVDYVSSEEIRDALKALCGTRIDAGAAGRRHGARIAQGSKPAGGAWVDMPPYQIDVLVRGSEALAKTKDGRMARCRSNHVGLDAHPRLAVGPDHAVLELPAAHRGAGGDRDDLHHFGHGDVHPGGTQGDRLDAGAPRAEPRQFVLDPRAWPSRSPTSSS